MLNIGQRVKNLISKGETGTIVNKTVYLKPLSSNDPIYGTCEAFHEMELCLALNNPNEDYGYMVEWDKSKNINCWVAKELEAI